MGSVVVIQSNGIGGPGADVTPAAVNWGNISLTGTTGLEDNSATQQTISAITAATSIQLKAAWTSTSSSPTKGYWVKNGVQDASPALTPVYVNATNSDILFFAVYDAYTSPAGNYDTGTVTVTNQSDGGAGLDTFTFAVRFVYSGGGGGGGGASGPGGAGGHYPPDPV